MSTGKTKTRGNRTMKNFDKRCAEIERIAESVSDGANGRIFELECASEFSRKTRVSKQGEADIHIKYERGTRPAECKTNGGRIGSLYAKDAPLFVIYRLDWTQHRKPTKAKPNGFCVSVYVEPKIIPTALFLAKLAEFGAIKSTNGTNPEPAIQVSSKKWHEWLASYPVNYDSARRYTASDFEGLH